MQQNISNTLGPQKTKFTTPTKATVDQKPPWTKAIVDQKPPCANPTADQKPPCANPTTDHKPPCPHDTSSDAGNLTIHIPQCDNFSNDCEKLKKDKVVCY